MSGAESVAGHLERELGDRVRTDPESRAAHRRDRWVLSELFELEGRPAASPVAVVEPETADEVATVLRICRETRAPIVPFGGGSGVCGAIVAPEGAVVLSTRRLDGLVELDDLDLTARFRAGTNGLEAEERVRRDGLTIGHWPQSIALSTVGGWVATRAAGQYSTGYGNIEDLVLALEVVLPDGAILRTRETPRAAAGPDLRQLFLGSEGTLGVVTEVTFSLRPLPAASRGQAFHFEDFPAGLGALRTLMREGWRPPVARLYDPPESGRHFPDACPPERAMLLLLHEGPAALVEAQGPAIAALCEAAGGTPADPAVVDHWLEHRNTVPGFRPFLEQGVVLDTIEVACTWERVAALYERVTTSLREAPGILLASGHSSHSYRSGTNLYFTFLARPGEAAGMEATYRECWRRTLQATHELGGGIAHHHGIGRVRRDFLDLELGGAGVALLRTLKRALDPHGLLNPGALLPPLAAELALYHADS
jgi:alkyldihydroxyacetonephosphate synthase